LLFCPTDTLLEVENLLKARRQLGWVVKTLFEDLVKEMLQADIQIAKGLIPDTSIIKN
jgi:GDP-D-mannose dehydratase